MNAALARSLERQWPIDRGNHWRREGLNYLMQARVLVVDDEPVGRSRLQCMLGREGCQTAVAADERTALDAIRDRGYDLVITNLCTPRMDGVTLVKRLRERQPDLAALLVAVVPWDERARAADIDILVKPFTRRDLRESVRFALTCPLPGSDHAPTRLPEERPEVGTKLVLPDHSWARVERNGLLTIGVEPALARGLVGLRGAELCQELDELAQWEPCARVALGRGKVEIVRTPVSLRVVRVNRALFMAPWAIVHDPLRAGWLCTGEAFRLSRDSRALRILHSDGRVIADEEPL